MAVVLLFQNKGQSCYKICTFAPLLLPYFLVNTSFEISLSSFVKGGPEPRKKDVIKFFTGKKVRFEFLCFLRFVPTKS